MDSCGRGGQRGGEEEEKKEKSEVKIDPGPTLMVVSWTAKIPRALTRVVIKGGGLYARANLNGGELDEEPSLRDEGPWIGPK